MENPKKFTVGKVHKKFHNTDLNEVNSRTSYHKYHNEISASRSEKSAQEINDNISEKANSVQTSYQYRKRQNEENSICSKRSSNHQHQNNKQFDEQLSLSMNDSDNLICANCINSVLIEEKQKRSDFDKYYPNNDGFFQDNNRNYENNIIDERRRQREYKTNEAIQNLAKINAGMSSKEKLIQMNENSRNPLNDGLPDYQYKKFQENYERRQRMINENINKFYPKAGNERPEIASYYDNYVYNPKYNNDNINEDYNNINRDYTQKDKDREEYKRSLEEQINEKNEIKKREKEEDRKRAKQQYENMQREIRKEEEERLIKEQRQKEELIKANNDLIEQKNKIKMKELEDKLKYKEYYDKQDEDYKKELLNKKLENERRKNDIYNDNKNEYENRKKNQRQEKNDERYNNIKNENNEEQQKKEKMGRCCRCHRVFPRRLLTINRYFYTENRK